MFKPKFQKFLQDGFAQELDKFPIEAAPVAASGVVVSRARLVNLGASGRLNRASLVNA